MDSGATAVFPTSYLDHLSLRIGIISLIWLFNQIECTRLRLCFNTFFAAIRCGAFLLVCDCSAAMQLPRDRSNNQRFQLWCCLSLSLLFSFRLCRWKRQPLLPTPL